ncbi:receptor-like serine/threonine-protein kinase SD1-8 [Pistacia vera]|uniref:receptor-like serine/threonine-protein kinase SD1-8 n=1 Tax=Pistacia vera TaxID=55513 RepID=UPI001263AFF1|nr:receptor-like serine/threonine-protein kinase SD1-8 [Pistacia vera]
MWQSFDYPSDTLLTGMKLGWNLKTGFERYLTSWRSVDDPSATDFSFRLEINDAPQLYISSSSKKVARSGPWNGVQFGGIPMTHNKVFKLMVVHNEDELYYMYKPFDDTVLTRLIVNQSSGTMQRFVFNQGSGAWEIEQCGANSNCRTSRTPMCECLKGFVPKSQDDWGTPQTTTCVKKSQESDCPDREGFLKLVRMKVPDNNWSNQSMNTQECWAKCLKNCSCMAYANSDISGKGSGCLMWSGDLTDIKECSGSFSWGQDLYIRVPASELVNHSYKKKIMMIVVTVVSIIFCMFLLGLLVYKAWKKTRSKGKEEVQTSINMENRKEDIEVPLFDLATIVAATNNFSHANMIGEGGFGPVYKGTLLDGQEIAVKRLSKKSGQGLEEFKNEVELIGKLQHRNLVALVGGCIEGDERMLIYEYMPNKSLDYFIFDKERRELLSWKKRFEIIIGIARGLLYLHQDSTLKVVHRDLKTSNVLLDRDLNPKISDFGLARIFGDDDTEVSTKRVVGTYGYMSPEYATEGIFSLQSDVYSFGVLLLEIITGKRNKGFRHIDHHHNLIGHAWLLWNNGRALELMDRHLEDSFIESKVQRCIQVGLLCVQKFPENRPDMSSVVFMLANEEVALPRPREPGFFTERGFSTDTSSSKETANTQNALSITIPEGR